jgi:O-antigen/teichoic acid export membrane protein
LTKLFPELRKLALHSAVYGAADVFSNVVNLGLVPLYTAYLSPADYGVVALLVLFSTTAKILFRLGLDGAFFRVHYDLDTPEEKRTLAGTVAIFAAVVGTVLFLAVVVFAAPLTRVLFGAQSPPSSFVVLAALDVYLGMFAFVPLNVLRIQDRPGAFSTFSAVRHTINTLLKVVLVMRGMGVHGILVADACATGLFSLSLLPILVRNTTPAFSRPLLREVLRFGLPKVPHGLLIQAQNFADRRILLLFFPLAEVGRYHMGYTFGQGIKFAISAFEPAWQPFIYSEIRTPEAPQMMARVVTYAWACFTAVALPLAVLAPELTRLMTFKNPDFWTAAPIVPPVVLAYLLHGGFLLTSIGIGIQKRASFYPAITAVTATVNIGADLLLVPRFGALGAAWATVLCYAVMLGLGLAIGQRIYPVPFEWPRLLRVSGAAAACYAFSLLAPGTGVVAALGEKCFVLLLFPLLVLLSGFLRADERLWLRARTGLG